MWIGVLEDWGLGGARGAIGAIDSVLAFQPSDKCSRRRSPSLANSVRH